MKVGANRQAGRFREDVVFGIFPVLAPIIAAVLLAQGGFSDFASFGAAGIMGAMWLFERRQGHKRDTQLDDAHARIMADRLLLDVLLKVVQANSEAISRLTQKLDERT